MKSEKQQVISRAHNMTISFIILIIELNLNSKR